ncbi:probable aminopeptidase NPEPL1 [Lingula anatina]|uniref:Probable aminopeptidase NPEPL1 n=1 Tax=Lingula anatina TaxID=7574 RepID=A0A1S3HUE9_LINAN|nr:probable aminopeptidase NPEPL1 [Lingula anatina]|eukprot:XP_013389670.1 probable aminopeptidase NPEPL1 [Lingula anatina]
MAMATVKFSADLTPSDPQHYPVVIIGQLTNLVQVKYDTIKCKLEPRVDRETYNAALNSLHPSPTDSCALWLSSATLAALPTNCSRHNSPSRAHSLTKIVKGCTSGGDEYFVIVCEHSDVFASGCAIARAFPLYLQKSGTGTKRVVTVEFILVGQGSDQPLCDSELECLTNAAYGVRLAAKVVDMPCAEMNTTAFLTEINRVGSKLKIIPTVIEGEDLQTQGFGGIYNVGKAASHPPVLAVLSHTPPGATKSIAWVGKGIVYDTGGLCIKGKVNMCGMKRDCGGAAAILGAFYAAVKQGFTDNLHAVFCLAENAVGPDALRPDDIITMYSGRTVEINNTDAEGRLVLGDGVMYAKKDLKADIILDMATLTGAQGIATGRYHGAFITNRADWEVMCVQAGQSSGDLLHPMPYCPELHFSEFASALADMKNSVADRSNAQVSCAGLFIGSHIGFDYPGVWVHVDMAFPVHVGERATGYGVALLLVLFGQMSSTPMLQVLSPSIGMCDVNHQQNESASKRIKLNADI